MIVTSLPTYVTFAFCSGPLPCQLPPTSAVPPPPTPETSTFACSNSPTLSPSTFTVPPR
ncbi:MAG: hypothetical protein IPM03_02585 [Sulfuritalea sp.]|nr:hypothetical protein [Sulfuritalea sp.]